MPLTAPFSFMLYFLVKWLKCRFRLHLSQVFILLRSHTALKNGTRYRWRFITVLHPYALPIVQICSSTSNSRDHTNNNGGCFQYGSTLNNITILIYWRIMIYVDWSFHLRVTKKYCSYGVHQAFTNISIVWDTTDEKEEHQGSSTYAGVLRLTYFIN